MNLKEFELIKKELEKYPLKVRYIYLLQLQKYLEKTTKDTSILKEIDKLLKEIEAKFAHDTSWKRDVLTSLINQNREERVDDRHRPIRNPIEEIIQREQQKKPEEQPGVRYGSSAEESGYAKAGYFSKNKEKSNDLYSTSSSSGGTGRSHEEQQEKFAHSGYSHHKSMEEEIEEHHIGKRTHHQYK